MSNPSFSGEGMSRRNFIRRSLGAAALALGAEAIALVPAAPVKAEGIKLIGLDGSALSSQAAKPAVLAGIPSYTLTPDGSGECGPTVQFKTSDNAIDAHYVPQAVRHVSITQTNFTGLGLDKWVSAYVNTPYLQEIDPRDPAVQRDSEGALILPLGRYI